MWRINFLWVYFFHEVEKIFSYFQNHSARMTLIPVNFKQEIPLNFVGDSSVNFTGISFVKYGFHI